MVTLEDLYGAVMALKDATDVGFLHVNSRLDRLEVRMDRLELRMDQLELRMERLEWRMDGLERRVGNLETRVEALEGDMKILHVKIGELTNRFDTAYPSI